MANDKNFMDDLKQRVRDESGATEWTPWRTLAVAGGALLIVGIIAVVIVKAKRK
jgi:hypothetical protein